jgi:hypothetical protein
MKIHRAVTLALMILLALLLITWAVVLGVSNIDSRSLASLGVVLAAAAIAGAAFSLRRYFPRNR